jgi:HPt (histidine-containing phosphotransfer) domain-containing protein
MEKPAIDHLDTQTLNSLRQVMEDDFGLLIETFVQDSHERIRVLSEAIAAANPDAIRRAAHSFKGSSSNIGALQLVRLCAAVEHKALSSQLEQLELDLQHIEDEFAQVEQLLLALD